MTIAIIIDVKEFISYRRFEGMSVHYALQGFAINDCAWLLPPGGDKRSSSPSEASKRRELLEEFIFWYFDSFLIPLLKVCDHSEKATCNGLQCSSPPFTSRIPPHFGRKYYTFDMMTGMHCASLCLIGFREAISSALTRHVIRPYLPTTGLI